MKRISHLLLLLLLLSVVLTSCTVADDGTVTLQYQSETLGAISGFMNGILSIVEAVMNLINTISNLFAFF